MPLSPADYRALRADRILATAPALRQRIAERFPGSGLSRVAGELVEVAGEAMATVERIRRPNLALRVATFGFSVLGHVGRQGLEAIAVVGLDPYEGRVGEVRGAADGEEAGHERRGDGSGRMGIGGGAHRGLLSCRGSEGETEVLRASYRSTGRDPRGPGVRREGVRDPAGSC